MQLGIADGGYSADTGAEQYRSTYSQAVNPGRECLCQIVAGVPTVFGSGRCGAPEAWPVESENASLDRIVCKETVVVLPDKANARQDDQGCPGIQGARSIVHRGCDTQPIGDDSALHHFPRLAHV
jgi:hypothetical protein